MAGQYVRTVVKNSDGSKRVIEKKVNQKPRKGLTIRMIRQANVKIRTPLLNMPTLRVLKHQRGPMKLDKPRLGLTGSVFAHRFIIRDTERTTPRSPICRHTITIFRQDGEEGKFAKPNVNVVVQCTCEFFMYYCEYALAHYSAGYIKFSNGQPPLTTNGGLIPFSCKHIELAFRELIKKGQ